MGKVNLWLNWNVYLATDNNSANEPHLFLALGSGVTKLNDKVFFLAENTIGQITHLGPLAN